MSDATKSRLVGSRKVLCEEAADIEFEADGMPKMEDSPMPLPANVWVLFWRRSGEARDRAVCAVDKAGEVSSTDFQGVCRLTALSDSDDESSEPDPVIVSDPSVGANDSSVCT